MLFNSFQPFNSAINCMSTENHCTNFAMKEYVLFHKCGFVVDSRQANETVCQFVKRVLPIFSGSSPGDYSIRIVNIVKTDDLERMVSSILFVTSISSSNFNNNIITTFQFDKNCNISPPPFRPM